MKRRFKVDENERVALYHHLHENHFSTKGEGK